MGDGAYFRHALFRTVDGVIDREEMFGRQLVRPLDRQRLAPPHFKRWPRPHAVVAPHGSRRQIAMCLMTKRNHADRNRPSSRFRSNHRRNRQRSHVARERSGRLRLVGRRTRRALPCRSMICRSMSHVPAHRHARHVRGRGCACLLRCILLRPQTSCGKKTRARAETHAQQIAPTQTQRLSPDDCLALGFNEMKPTRVVPMISRGSAGPI